MILAELLEGVQVIKLFSAWFGRMVLTQDLSINSIQYDSRKVKPDDLFVAIRGAVADGHRYQTDAISRGAVAVVVDDDAALPDTYFHHTNVFKILVPDSRKALAQIAGNYHHHPSRSLRLVGVTGTNGKTTTTHLLRAVLEADGNKAGLIGTIGISTGGPMRPATHTTPESLEVNALLAEMVAGGCSAAAMEVSSHALALSRVEGQRFAAAVFTNLTQDHLDFHHTMEEYAATKKKLFGMLTEDAVAITNADDPQGRGMVEGTKARVLTFGVREKADVRADNVAVGLAGITMDIVTGGRRLPVRARLTGKFNVENILAAFATGVGLGGDPEQVAGAIALHPPVRGRFEQIISPDGWTAVLDYAHTPDALEQALLTLRALVPPGGGRRIITVFGCGGDRDRTKRPVMGRIAASLSDVTIVTSDNPRTESPDVILDEILQGVAPGAKVERIVDRRDAIRAALGMAHDGDVVLLAGKGHEDYQIVGKEKRHFDDREEVEAVIAGRTP